MVDKGNFENNNIAKKKFIGKTDLLEASGKREKAMGHSFAKTYGRNYLNSESSQYLISNSSNQLSYFFFINIQKVFHIT